MATVLPNPDGVPEDLRKRLALAVRSIGWTYAIFWSITSIQPGVLEWSDGYYNGDIKTRKTVQVQAVEHNADQIGLLRSEQLRELFGSLSAGETSPLARRPSVALSPEDLSDTEWYYLVCMSFVFNVGQGLPGKALANGQFVWLCNAHISDSKVFSRSLLAKSASIQTVVAFPFLGGVVELGVTEAVMEDPNLIQNIKATFLENPYAIVSTKLTSMSGNQRDDDDVVPCTELDCEILKNILPVEECEKVEIDSPDTMFYRGEDAFVVEGMNEGPSQVQCCWHFKDGISNIVQNPASSIDCISQTFLNPKKVDTNQSILEPQGGNCMKQNALDLRTDNVHYHVVLADLLKSSDKLVLGSHFGNSRKESCFSSWKKEGLVDSYKQGNETSQRLLKKVLFTVAQMHVGNLLETGGDESRRNHVLLERKERENINKRFMILKSVVPKIKQVDNVSILDYTIKYLEELRRRVDDLESRIKVKESEERCRRKPRDTAEGTSNNSGNTSIGGRKQPLMNNKRKACDIEEMSEIDSVLLKAGAADEVIVSATEKGVSINIRCLWREGLFLEIMDMLRKFQLDFHDVQSSITDGALSLTITSEVKKSAAVSVGVLREALRSVIWKF